MHGERAKAHQRDHNQIKQPEDAASKGNIGLNCTEPARPKPAHLLAELTISTKTTRPPSTACNAASADAWATDPSLEGDSACAAEHLQEYIHIVSQ
jgi:hypothetical protein